MPGPWDVLQIVRRTVTVARDQQITLLAAGVAFYAFLSLVPLALVVIGVATSVGGERLALYVTEGTSEILTPSAQELLLEELGDETGQQGATVFGALGLLWASSRVFRGLDRAFALVYGTAAEKSFVDTLWDAVIVAGAIAAGVGLVGALEVGIVLAPVPVLQFVGPLLVLPALIAAFFPLYYVFPAVDVTVREALPGTLFSAIGWLVLSRSFGIYTAVVGGDTVYGALGAVFLVLVWLYLGAIVVVFGAVLNAVLADRDVASR